MKESKKRKREQLDKLMGKSHSQPVNLPGAQPLGLMNPLSYNMYYLNLYEYEMLIEREFCLLIIFANISLLFLNNCKPPASD